MDNVIRPAFRRQLGKPERGDTALSADACRPLRIYGVAAGYRVALIRGDDGPEGDALRIIVGPIDATTIEAVAMMPATPEGEVDAEVTAMAILRTLEVIEGDAGPAA